MFYAVTQTMTFANPVESIRIAVFLLESDAKEYVESISKYSDSTGFRYGVVELPIGFYPHFHAYEST